jgi:hypothetical protein
VARLFLCLELYTSSLYLFSEVIRCVLIGMRIIGICWGQVEELKKFGLVLFFNWNVALLRLVLKLGILRG